MGISKEIPSILGAAIALYVLVNRVFKFFPINGSPTGSIIVSVATYGISGALANFMGSRVASLEDRPLFNRESADLVDDVVEVSFSG